MGLLLQPEDAEGNFVDRVALPEAKIQKMGALPQDPELVPGERAARLQTVQRPRGAGGASAEHGALGGRRADGPA